MPQSSRRAGLLRTGGVVDVFHGRVPAAGRDVATELGELVLGFLVEGANTGVEGNSHGNLTGSGLP